MSSLVEIYPNCMHAGLFERRYTATRGRDPCAIYSRGPHVQVEPTVAGTASAINKQSAITSLTVSTPVHLGLRHRRSSDLNSRDERDDDSEDDGLEGAHGGGGSGEWGVVRVNERLFGFWLTCLAPRHLLYISPPHSSRR
jgi:hypothetical protein